MKLDPKVIEAYEGEYIQATSRFGALKPATAQRLTVRYHSGQLTYQLNQGRQVAIYKVRDNEYRTTNQSAATMAFMTFDGKTYFQGEFGNFVKLIQ